MQVDRQQFKEEGYNILREVVPKAELSRCGAALNTWSIRGRRYPPNGVFRVTHEAGDWESSGQPRLKFDTDCDEMSASAIEFLLHENTLGGQPTVDGSRTRCATPIYLYLQWSRDVGPMLWHRDIGPGEPAPLRGMISNMEHHGPSYLQWNIALYDDSVFWIVPRSHRRINTEVEHRQLAEIHPFHCRTEFLLN